MSNGFNREKLLEFLKKNPDKVPCMCTTLRNEINNNYHNKIKSMPVSEILHYLYGNTGLIKKEIINRARYGI
tara:strand:+ start:9066 stop:9281 length:216 start_codon:yes stop_codon:yes gene_type:complete